MSHTSIPSVVTASSWNFNQSLTINSLYVVQLIGAKVTILVTLTTLCDDLQLDATEKG